jgi:hypothetical protein
MPFVLHTFVNVCICAVREKGPKMTIPCTQLQVVTCCLHVLVYDVLEMETADKLCLIRSRQTYCYSGKTPWNHC